jgi:hypothetical protein
MGITGAVVGGSPARVFELGVRRLRWGRQVQIEVLGIVSRVDRGHMVFESQH